MFTTHIGNICKWVLEIKQFILKLIKLDMHIIFLCNFNMPIFLKNSIFIQ